MGLVRTMIGVLTDDDYFDSIKGATIKGFEDILRRGVNSGSVIFAFDVIGEVFKIRLIKFGLKYILPTAFNFDFHGVYFTL